jgi:hypothetical protein
MGASMSQQQADGMMFGVKDEQPPLRNGHYKYRSPQSLSIDSDLSQVSIARTPHTHVWPGKRHVATIECASSPIERHDDGRVHVVVRDKRSIHLTATAPQFGTAKVQ